MLRLPKILLVLIVITIAACKEKEAGLRFNKEEKLIGKEIFKQEVNIFRLFYLEDYILSKNNNSSDFMFSVYNTKKELVKHICKKGEGPGEFSDLTEFAGYDMENNEIKIHLLDIRKSILSTLNLSKSIKENSEIIENRYPISIKSNFDQFLRYIKPNLLVGGVINLDVNMSRVRFYNVKSKEIVNNYPLVPFIENNKKEDLTFRQYTYNTLYTSILSVKPDKKRLVSAMHKFDRFDILNIEGKPTKVVEYNSEINKKRNNPYSKDNESRVFYSDISTTNRYIYLLYINQAIVDYPNKSISTEVHVYDWNGNPIKKYLIPNYLNFITVNEDDTEMMGISTPNEEIVSFKL